MKVLIGNYPKSSDKERKVQVRIDEQDIWSMDSTLAYIIHPMLVKLKETKHGSPSVDDEDVPEHLRSTSAPPKENEWDIDDLWHSRWEWALDEMIWSFKTINEDHDHEYYTPPEGEWDVNNLGKLDHEKYKEFQDRMTNGFRLFGKYYQALWD